MRLPPIAIKPAMSTPTPRRSARKNIYDNWYGYVGGKRVIAFSNTASHTQEEEAEHWLKHGVLPPRPTFTMKMVRK